MTARAPMRQRTGLRIALLGAESTGKTRLAGELAAHLRAAGMQAVAVPEALRAWCEREGRAPRPEEQLGVAQAQERQVDEAAAAGAACVIADTTALMVLVYSGMLFEDDPLYRFAIERQQGYDATLVTGLDLPWQPDGLQRNPSQPREPVDALVRTLLQRAGVPFQVVYGSGTQRLRGALAALGSTGVLPAQAVAAGPPESQARAWVWNCEKCSDP
ncbi:MAG TPA: ATP-binding protein, partial [Ramlibacter sp.]|nr:ATP-binding protein [Ramlibacter sp.]